MRILIRAAFTVFSLATITPVANAADVNHPQVSLQQAP
jgi:hypothetical protein